MPETVVVEHKRLLSFPIMVHDNSRHNRLKARAALWLEDLGLTAYVEVPVRLKDEEGNVRFHVIDVIGLTRSGEALAVECGYLNESVAYRVRGAFLALFHWPYTSSKPYLVDECEEDGHTWKAELAQDRTDLFRRDSQGYHRANRRTNRGGYSMLRQVSQLCNNLGGSITSAQVADKLGISRESASTYLSSYTKKGYMECIGEEDSGGRKRNVYTMTDKPIGRGMKVL